MTRRRIIALSILPLVTGQSGLRANNLHREAEACDCDPYNYKYDLECCGPACAFPDSRFYDITLCSCDPCDVKGVCFDIEHCCDPCIKESSCFSEEQCCDKCDPRSYCFDFYADCDIHYTAQTTSIQVNSMTVATEAEDTANVTVVDAKGVEIDPEVVTAEAMSSGGVGGGE